MYIIIYSIYNYIMNIYEKFKDLKTCIECI